jgi:YbbR domain-containing protein
MRIFSSPQTVSLTVVGGIEYISNLKPSELEVSVDFNNWREDKQFYEIRVNTPNDVLDWMDLSPMSIELIVTQKNS